MLVCVSLPNLAHETAGAARPRSSLRPLIGEGGNLMANLASNRRRDRGGMCRRHCEERSDEAIHAFLCGQMDCFAPLAMTVLATAPYPQLSSLRKQGPITPAACWSKSRRPPCP